MVLSEDRMTVELGGCVTGYVNEWLAGWLERHLGCWIMYASIFQSSCISVSESPARIIQENERLVM